VGVGKLRCASVSLLLATFPDTELVILDDAFQHLSIARDLDFICFDAKWALYWEKDYSRIFTRNNKKYATLLLL
jgi:tetraacyldisaccharide-1-P 4'-kinase